MGVGLPPFAAGGNQNLNTRAMRGGASDLQSSSAIPQRAQAQSDAANPSAILDLDLGLRDGVGSGFSLYNLLDDYMNVIYHIRFSMVHWEDAERLQRDLAQFNSLTNEGFTIASTGATSYVDETVTVQHDQFVPPLRVEHRFPYYAINKLTMSNYLGPSQANPMISNMTEMKMTMVQPYGFSLHKDLLNLATGPCGYQDQNPGRIIYRVDIWWSGFNENTGEWVPRIPIINVGNINTDTITNFVIIRTLDAYPTSSGTTYEMTLTPIQSFAYNPEVIITNGQNLQIEGNTLRSLFASMKSRLETAIAEETNRLVRYQYNFYAPNELLDAEFTKGPIQEVLRMAGISETATISRGQDIFTFLGAAIADLKLAQDLGISDEGNPMFTKPAVFFNIRMATRYEQFEPQLNDWSVVIHDYFIEPYLSFKKLPPLGPDNFETVVSTEAQQQRLDEMLNYRMVFRKYDYFLTGENTEVIDFKFHYRMFYYHALSNTATIPRNNHHSHGHSSGATPVDIAQEQQREVMKNQPTPGGIGGGSAAAQQVLGPNGMVGLVNTVMPLYQAQGRAAQAIGTGTAAARDRMIQYINNYDQFLQLDHQTLENMIVRGDPIWLVNDYVASAPYGLSFLQIPGNPELRVQIGRIILLRALAPDQESYMDPQRRFGSVDTSMLGGFYEINEIISEFDNGRFTQNLKGTKLNHINYTDMSVYGRRTN